MRSFCSQLFFGTMASILAEARHSEWSEGKHEKLDGSLCVVKFFGGSFGTGTSEFDGSCFQPETHDFDATQLRLDSTSEVEPFLHDARFLLLDLSSLRGLAERSFGIWAAWPR